MHSSYHTVSHLLSSCHYYFSDPQVPHDPGLAQHHAAHGPAGVQNQSCLHLASSRQDQEAASIVKLLLTHWTKDIVTQVDNSLNIPLFCAIEVGNTEVVQELLTINNTDQVTKYDKIEKKKNKIELL